MVKQIEVQGEVFLFNTRAVVQTAEGIWEIGQTIQTIKLGTRDISIRMLAPGRPWRVWVEEERTGLILGDPKVVRESEQNVEIRVQKDFLLSSLRQRAKSS